MPAQARVFDFGEDGFAPYIGAHYFMFNNGSSGFDASSGVDTEFDQSLKSALSYEFGFAYGFRKFRFLFGFQFLRPSLLEVTGSDAGGVAQYTLTHDLSAFIPRVGLEISIKQWKENRFYFEALYGSATVTASNTYAFTAAGTGSFGLADFKEEVRGTAPMMQAGVGFETLAFDSTTLHLSLGYRNFVVSSLKHNMNSTGFQGAVAEGDPATNNDGADRSLDLNGLYASVLFRFWLF